MPDAFPSSDPPAPSKKEGSARPPAAHPPEPMPSFDRPEVRLANSFLRGADFAFVRLYHRLTVKSPSQLPESGPAILVCNHTSALDPMLLQAASKRMIVWMMAAEYYRKAALGWFFRAVQAIPVERSGRDLAATRAALRALEAGRILGIFPEGRIEKSRELIPFQTGVALMAIKSSVPVYPAYLDGTQRTKDMLSAVVRRNHATVSFGPVVEIDRVSTSREALQAATASIQDAVKRLRQASARVRSPSDRNG